MGLRRVVVTGLGALTPIGNDVNTVWTSLVQGISGAGPITRFDPEKFKTKFACEVKGYDPLNFFERKEVRKFDLFSQFGIVAADEAIRDSGFKQERYDPERVGVIWASGIGGIITLTEEIKAYVSGDGTPRFSPFFIPKMISDITSGHIAIKHGFMGPNFSTVSACASSANAIVDAFNSLQRGKADIIITGGSEASISEAGIGGFNAMHALSTRNDDPKSASRPFDKDRDGFVVAEGACALVLEDMEHALARGAKIYCEISGAGLSADAYHITAPHPEGLGAALAMKLAIEDANFQPTNVDHINTHGTSTPQGDISEVKAILRVFGEHAYKLNINSTKSMTGHMLGAAGAIEALATILAVYYDIIPPTINHFTDDPEIDPALNFTFHHAQHRKVNVAISNTFGFGGHNASILMQKFFK
ncbi:MAG TPA: beta-ketoacyl-[acyl-carrier-protein] synthase II [Bacteroidales bacterium]|jgi:3-oxoacyl-[acyl-carrier-protein] synthase II|nr:beta-ketoacyl-[acyl-carrier-protein] synthase II [Bacteroidales bacterium]HQQ01384.1 beta-ketoacyl-ACP synthase II [Bacteroidales bacterium]